MQSAKTSLPSASVFPIYTAIPFLDLIISSGRYELSLMKFQTKPMEAVKFTFSFSFATLYIALKTEAAPCLSICIYFIPAVDFRFSPPESKQTPFPTNDTHSCDSGLPLQAKFMNIDQFLLALPTACIKLNPQCYNYEPLKVVIFKLFYFAICCAFYRKKFGFAQSPLVFAHYLARRLAAASSNTYSFYLNYLYSILTWSGFFYFLENLQGFVSKIEASPIKSSLFWTYQENQTYKFFFGFILIAYFLVVIIFFVSFYITSTLLFFLNYYFNLSGINLSAYLEWITNNFQFKDPVEGEYYGNMLENCLTFLKKDLSIILQFLLLNLKIIQIKVSLYLSSIKAKIIRIKKTRQFLYNFHKEVGNWHNCCLQLIYGFYWNNLSIMQFYQHYYQQQMGFNEQLEVGESSACLIEWINIQRQELGKRGYLLAFNQAIEEGSFEQILKNVQPTLFQTFGNLQPYRKMDIIQKYLDREFGKRMKWSFKQSLGSFEEQSHYKQFAKLVCYFSIHSKNKNQIINRILTLSEQSQKNLMQAMQKMQQKLENIVQIRQILEQIQYLECQNEQLKKALQQMNKANSQLLEMVKQSENQTRKVKQQNEKLIKEKCDVFSTLKIYYMSEYLQAYNRLRFENEKSMIALRQSEIKIERSQDIIKQLSQRIKCDCTVINTLSQQINRLKELYNESQQRNQYGDFLKSGSKQNALKSSSKSNNKQNMSKCSTSLGKSMEVPAEWLTLLENQEQIHDKSSLRSYNQQLMGKLENMYTKYNQLNQQTVFLRQKNKELSKSYKDLRHILKSVQQTQSQYEFKYAAADQEARRRIKGLIKIKH